jgi:uncharacterized protein
VGLAGGLVSGLLGVGGGLVMVPALVLWVGVDQRLAQVISLAAIVPIAAFGGALFVLDGEVDLMLALLLGVGGIVGSAVGVRLLDRLGDQALRWAFATIAFLAGLRLVTS